MSVLKAAILAALLSAGSVPIAGPAAAQPVLMVTADIAPPPLPVYLQPAIPGPGYLWSPGYWDFEPAFGYYWVPGTWVLPPRPNLLWTPAYWGWSDGVYVFHRGYWGQQVGFYGGVVYGFGYTGTGFQGGYWNAGAFFYNRYVTNITNVSVTNVYSETVVNAGARTSYNGGAGGTTARPTPQQNALAQQNHEPPTPAQSQQAGLARANPAQRLSANHGLPPVAATPRPHAFGDPGAVSATPVGHAGQPGAPAVHQPAVATPANALPSGNALPAGRLSPNAQTGAPLHGPGAPPVAAGIDGHANALPAPQQRAITPQQGMQTGRGQAARGEPMAPRMNLMALPRTSSPYMASPHVASPRMSQPHMSPPRMSMPHMAPQRMAQAPRRPAAGPRHGRH